MLRHSRTYRTCLSGWEKKYHFWERKTLSGWEKKTKNFLLHAISVGIISFSQFLFKILTKIIFSPLRRWSTPNSLAMSRWEHSIPNNCMSMTTVICTLKRKDIWLPQRFGFLLPLLNSMVAFFGKTTLQRKSVLKTSLILPLFFFLFFFAHNINPTGFIFQISLFLLHMRCILDSRIFSWNPHDWYRKESWEHTADSQTLTDFPNRSLCGSSSTSGPLMLSCLLICLSRHSVKIIRDDWKAFCWFRIIYCFLKQKTWYYWYKDITEHNFSAEERILEYFGNNKCHLLLSFVL